MSKTQDKRAARKAEAEEFVKQRRNAQITMFENNFRVGLEFYEKNKSQMSEEEQLLIEQEIEKNRKLIDDFKDKWF
jgi:DNA segregation ATPase FtsK/SpoIIIE-like protein